MTDRRTAIIICIGTQRICIGTKSILQLRMLLVIEEKRRVFPCPFLLQGYFHRGFTDSCTTFATRSNVLESFFQYYFRKSIWVCWSSETFKVEPPRMNVLLQLIAVHVALPWCASMRDRSHVLTYLQGVVWDLTVQRLKIRALRAYVSLATMVAVLHGERSQVCYRPLFINFFCKSSKDRVFPQPEEWWPLFFRDAEEFLGTTLPIG